MRDLRIMILGAGGFIGSHLSNSFIENGCVVHGFGRNLNNLKFNDGYFIKSDSSEINENSFLNTIQPDYIYFLIGSASVAKSIELPLFDFNQSIPPLMAVLEKIRKDWQSTRLIFISSAAVYGDNASDNTSVKCNLIPLSPYGLNKKISEEYVKYYIEHYGINAKIIRPFSVYGPGLKKQLIWDVLNKIKRNEHHFFGSGDELRDWIYIDDFISILRHYTCDYDSMDSVVNVGSGEPVKVKKVIETLYDITHTEEAPSFIDGGKEGDPKHLVSSYKEQNCVRPFLTTTLESGLQSTVDWFKKTQEQSC
ncbi:TPA: NAD-dependent epimerase/dehydratase family protein [Citrobacter amalonaticus]